MKITCLALFLIVFHFYCTDTPDPKQNPGQTGKSKIAKPGSSYTDTIRVNHPVALFYGPDSLQKERIKGILEKQVFETALHEYDYQMRNARKALKKSFPDIPIIEVTQARYILFHKNTGGFDLIDLDREDEFSGMFLFDGCQPPRAIEMMNIETGLEIYFQSSKRT